MASSSYKVQVINGFGLNEIALLMLDPHPKVHGHKKVTRITHLVVKRAGDEPGIWTMPTWEVEITGVEQTSNPDIWKIRGKRPLTDGAEYFRGLYSTKTREGFLFVTKAVRHDTVKPKHGKLLIVVRIGEPRYKGGGIPVSRIGQPSWEETLAPKLTPFFPSDRNSVFMLSSRQAFESALALKQQLGIRRLTTSELLWEYEQRQVNLRQTLDTTNELLQSKDVSVLIVVADEHLANVLPTGFCGTMMQFHIPTVRLNPGQACVIHVDERRDEIAEIIG